MCLDFRQNEFEPYADEWDEKKIFPVETLRLFYDFDLMILFEITCDIIIDLKYVGKLLN